MPLLKNVIACQWLSRNTIRISRLCLLFGVTHRFLTVISVPVTVNQRNCYADAHQSFVLFSQVDMEKSKVMWKTAERAQCHHWSAQPVKKLLAVVGCILPVSVSHSFEKDSSGMLSDDFFNFNKNLHLEFRMNWFDIDGQQWYSHCMWT